MDDVLDLPALEQARLMRKDELGSRELVRGYLARIEKVDASLSSFVEVLAESALEEATRADRFRGKDRPPFLGVPIGIKDLNAARGSFTRLGSRAMKLFSPFDDLTTAQLRRAGFVVIGKTATSEIGAMPVTEPDIHPPTRNPWDLSVTPGGSSGGAGAAVAAGLIPIAQGSDAGGSIRIPSAFCGLFGIKPSRGRVVNSYGFPDREILYSSGPMAHTVDDAAAMLDVMAGLTVGEPHWAPRPEATFAELARRPPSRLRVRFGHRTSLVATDPDVAAAVTRVAKLLSEMGHDVEEAPLLEGSVDEFMPIWQRLIATAPITDWASTQPVTRWLGEAGQRVTDAEVTRVMDKLTKQVLDWFAPADLWVLPTVAVAPPTIGTFRDLPPDVAFSRASQLGLFTALFNVTGQPAASVPAGLSRHGHPIGVQLVGKRLADATVLAVARRLEEAMPWRSLRPPAHARAQGRVHLR
jgi:amidase